MATTAHLGSPPGAWPLVGHFPAYGRDPLGFALRAASDFGGVVRVRFGPFPALLLTDPAAIEDVLVTRSRDFQKSRATRRVSVVVGNGLIVSEDETWRQHRRAVQPAFHHDRIAAWGEVMVAETETTVDAWDDGEVRDVHAEMVALTLRIVVRSLLGNDLEPHEIEDVRRAATVLTDHFDSRYNSLRYFIPDRLPTPGNLRMRAAVRRLDRIIYRLIGASRRSGRRGPDAISMLLEASQAGGIRMSDREMRDEVMTLFLAGHETTALAVAWSLHLLATHPETQSAVHDELAEVLGDRPPNVADVPRLHRLEAVVLEALRLFPPAYAVGREAIRPTTIAGTAVPKGTIAFISVWAAHRDPVRFPEPSAFRPERWLDGLARRLPRGAYLPFAEGPRKCIGAAFAMQEAVLLLATIARRFRLQPVEDHVVRLRPAVTLRPADGIKLRLRSKPPREAVVRRVSPVA